MGLQTPNSYNIYEYTFYIKYIFLIYIVKCILNGDWAWKLGFLNEEGSCASGTYYNVFRNCVCSWKYAPFTLQCSRSCPSVCYRVMKTNLLMPFILAHGRNLFIPQISESNLQILRTWYFSLSPIFIFYIFSFCPLRLIVNHKTQKSSPSL